MGDPKEDVTVPQSISARFQIIDRMNCPVSAVLGSYRLTPHVVFRVHKSPHFRGRGHQANLDVGSLQSDASHKLAALLVVLQPEDVFDTRENLGALAVAYLLGIAQRGVTLYPHAIVAFEILSSERAFCLFTLVGAVDPDLRVAILHVDYHVEDLVILDTGRRGRSGVDIFVLAIHTDVVLAAVVSFTVLYGPARIGVFLPTLVLRPFLGHLATLNLPVLVAAIAWNRYLDDTSVNDMPLLGQVAQGFNYEGEAVEKGFNQLEFVEPHSDLMFHHFVGQIIDRLQDQDHEHRQRIIGLRRWTYSPRRGQSEMGHGTRHRGYYTPDAPGDHPATKLDEAFVDIKKPGCIICQAVSFDTGVHYHCFGASSSPRFANVLGRLEQCSVINSKRKKRLTLTETVNL